jgi:hypothetical protein
MKKIFIIINKEKHSLYNKLILIGIRNNGIIFGGMVRDEIIASHYKSLFDKNSSALTEPKNHYNNFWNSEYQKETIKRTIIPNDMDIYFHNNENSELFLDNIKIFVNTYNGIISISNSFVYEFGEQLIHKKITLTFIIAKTFTSNGIIINVNIDMIINNNINNYIEPPFNYCDFSCNLFIMNKIYNDYYEIRLSKNTGTILDKMPYADKINFQQKIIDDLINDKVVFIRRSLSNNCEYINGIRILKMLDKNMQITNLTFKEIETTKIEQDCDICQMSVIPNEEPLIEILTNKQAANIMHKSCFIKYLRNEIYKKNINTETNQIECKCTRRNLFNFKDSYKFSYLYHYH